MPKLTRGRKPGPDPIDIEVGRRIRARRSEIGMSQTTLSSHLDLTFQQVQKYERGSNRCAPSTLVKIAKAMNVNVEYFVEGLGTRVTEADNPLQRDVLELNRKYLVIDDVKVRSQIRKMVGVFANAAS